MKKLVAAMTVAVIGLAFVGSSARAEDIKFGAKFGLNFAKFEMTDSGGSETSDSKFGVTIGGIVEIPMTDLITFQTGAQLAFKGGEPEGGGEVTINALEFPALAKFNFAEGMAYAVAGLNIGFITTAESEDGGTTRDFKDDMKGMNMELVIGGGGAFEVGEGKLSVGLQYEIGLTDLADWPAGGPTELKTKNLSIVVGYLF